MDIRIRPLIVEDAYTSYRWRNDKEVFKFTGNTYDHEITLETELEWINKVIANPNDFRCAILANEQYVGNIYLTDIASGVGHYHIFIGNRDFWGKGVAKMASQLIIEKGFKDLGLKEIVLSVRSGNDRAIHLYRSLGFKDTSINKDWIRMSITNHNY